MRDLFDILGLKFENVYYRPSLTYLIHNLGQEGFAAYLQFWSSIKEAEDEMPKVPG